jgi:hypothetical protein
MKYPDVVVTVDDIARLVVSRDEIVIVSSVEDTVDI